MDKWKMDGCKFLYHHDRAKAHYMDGEKIAPIHIDMGLSKFCNVGCKWCFGLFQNPSKEFINRDALMQTVLQAGEIGVKSIGFIGDGEPTCNPAWADALYAGHDAGIDMAMSSSTVAINNIEKALAVTDNCTWFRVCIGAGTREGYEKIHQRDYFDTVVKNIKGILKAKRATGSNTTVGLQTVFIPMFDPGATLDLAKLGVELGVDYVLVKQYSVPDDGASGMALCNLDDYENPVVVDELKAVEACSTDDTKCIVKWSVMARKGARDYEGCPSVPLLSEISGNGDWYPCGFMFGNKPEFDDYKFGNIQEQSLKEIWESDRYSEVINRMRYEFNSHTQCQGCCRLDINNSAAWNYLVGASATSMMGVPKSAYSNMVDLHMGDKAIDHRNFI